MGAEADSERANYQKRVAFPDSFCGFRLRAIDQGLTGELFFCCYLFSFRFLIID